MDDVNVLVTFYSQTGQTERMAVWIAEGAIQGGAKIRLRRARDLMPPEVVGEVPGWAENRDRMEKEYAAPGSADAEWADAIVLGTPGRLGTVSTELKAYLDLFAVSRPTGKLSGKIGSAFTSSYLAQTGNESALLGLQTLMLSLGLVVLPYAPAYVASPMPSTDAANERDLQFEWAHAHGKKVAEIARALKLAGIATRSPA